MLDSSLQVALLLEESVESAIARERSAFARAAEPFARSVVIFGAGNLGRKTAGALRANGIVPLAFSDNNSALWNTPIDGIPVLPPKDAAARYGEKAVFVVAIWGAGQTQRQADFQKPLRSLGVQRIVHAGLVLWAFPLGLLPHIALDLPHKVLQARDDVQRAFNLLADERSREEYVAQLRWRLHLDFDSLPAPVQSAQYFCDDLFSIPPGVRFIDGGAFDGDTIRGFLEHGRKDFSEIIAFEPDPLNFQKLTRYVASLAPEIRSRIRVRTEAIGASPGSLRFNAAGREWSSASEDGKLTVDVVTLDNVLADGAPGYIKLDIEGAEPDALAGAARVIGRHHPLLAVCAYHLQDHLWKIPLLIHGLSDRYNIHLRPHGQEVFELVCYAVPVEAAP